MQLLLAVHPSGCVSPAGASRGQTPTVKYVRAYAKIPSDANPSEDGLKCLSPAFGTEADVYVEIVVGALDGTQSIIRGKSKYTFFGACSDCSRSGTRLTAPLLPQPPPTCPLCRPISCRCHSPSQAPHSRLVSLHHPLVCCSTGCLVEAGSSLHRWQRFVWHDACGQVCSPDC